MSKRLLRALAPLALVALVISVVRLQAAEEARPANREPRHIATRRAADVDGAIIDEAADNLGRVRGIFRARVAKDRDMRIATASGRPVYACKPPRAARQSGTAGTQPLSAPIRSSSSALVAPSNVGTDTSTYINATQYPLDQTFSLHTRPGAARIMYLDFDGFTVHATDWNASNDSADDIVVPPFDLDGDPTTFNAAERAAIQETWRRVAEDYAPFDVDVTTQDPGEANLVYDGFGDDHWGMRMVFGGLAVTVLGPGNDGVIGVAFLESFQTGQSFDSNGNLGSDTPAFTFTEDILAYSPNFAAEFGYTSSHELGHTVGLSHDGDDTQEYYPGYAGWAPIMGSGPDPTVVVQFSKGEYLNANNQEDDLAMIAGVYLPYIAVDHGTNQAGAVTLASGDTAGGVILTATDTAWYKIPAGAGALSITGSVAAPNQPNLKIKLTLRDGAGNVVATSPTNNAMSATLTTNLAARGNYFLVVDGTSYLTPRTGFSDYDSVGRYSLTGTWRPLLPNVPPVASTAGSAPLTGLSPLTVNFVGSASTDADGTIASYSWNFGDGTPVSTLANPSHIYATPGNYTAILTVTDNDGATATANAPVSSITLPPKAKLIAVSAMSGSWATLNRTTGECRCTVTIYDNSGRPMPNAMVNVNITGLATGTRSVLTDKSGKATFNTPAIAISAKGKVTFSVTSATLAGYYYYPANNKVTSVSVSR